MKLPLILGSLLAGSLLVGSAVGQPAPPAPPAAPPAPPAAPAAPAKPAKAAKTTGSGSGIHIQIDGIDQMVDEQISHALDQMANDPNIPKAVRDNVTSHLKKVKDKLHDKLGKGKLDVDDLDEIGDEISREMEDMGKDIEKWVGSVDDDDDDDLDVDADADDDDLDDAVKSMGSLKLKGPQSDQIKKLRADSDAKVAAAKKELEAASKQLQQQLDNPATTDADLSKSIDAVAAQEAAIRKARILALHGARRVLDDTQRKQVDTATKGKKQP